MKPTYIVWASLYRGLLFRITKTDLFGNFVYDSSLRPEVWGWVCLQLEDDEKPRRLGVPFDVQFPSRACGFTGSFFTGYVFRLTSFVVR